MKGQFLRREMELGGWPMRNPADPEIPPGNEVHPCREGGEKPRHISKARLIQAMRKIDPDLADLIESLGPVYLVKK